MGDWLLEQASAASLDPNSLLSDLDRGLRSLNSGDQCEAIVRFPSLFERYPFPILINSASLKLAELFRNGSNFSRVLILKVMQQNTRHLDKILNMDEFVRRVFSVTYSNDPVARSLTLRLLGIMSEITAEREIIQHCIRSSLDSEETIELNAAIEATGYFAKKSPKFANNINGKIIGMIEAPGTSLEIKMALLSVFNHDNFTAASAKQVRAHLLKLLDERPDSKLKVALLNSLTSVSSASPFHAHLQMELLVKLFTEEDNNPLLSKCLMENLQNLISKRPHIWPDSSFPILMKYMDSTDQQSLFNTFTLINKLICSSSLVDERSFSSEKLLNQLIQCSLEAAFSSDNPLLLSAAIDLLCSLCVRFGSTKPNLWLEVSSAIQAILSTAHVLLLQSDDSSRGHTRKLFKSIANFAAQFSSSVPYILTSLYSIVLMVDTNDGYYEELSMETLCCVASYSQEDKSFPLTNEELVDLIQKFSGTTSSENSFVFAITLYFISCFLVDPKCDGVNINFISARLEGRNLWCLYRVIRQAMRFGLHPLASPLSEKLFQNASSENEYFWAMTLWKISESESQLMKVTADNIGNVIQNVIASYSQVISLLKSTKNSENNYFKLEYFRLRLRYLECHFSLDACCRLVQICPPPANAETIALYNRDEMLRTGAFVNEMRKCRSEFIILSDSYSKLYESSYNADDTTLLHIRTCQQTCSLISDMIEKLFKPNAISAHQKNINTLQPKGGGGGGHPRATTLSSEYLSGSRQPPVELKYLMNACKSLTEAERGGQGYYYQTTSLSNNLEDYVSKSVKLIDEMRAAILSLNNPIPRYVFQYDSFTSLKMATSPNNKTPNDLIIVNHSSNFVLGVEGVVVTCSKRSVSRRSSSKRSLSQISLSVTTTQTYKPLSVDSSLSKASDTNSLHTAAVTPHNDYFQYQFLITFPSAGIYTLSVEAAIVDMEGVHWRTGTSVNIHLKVADDSFRH